jgi:hypothetical protein
MPFAKVFPFGVFRTVNPQVARAAYEQQIIDDGAALLNHERVDMVNVKLFYVPID